MSGKEFFLFIGNPGVGKSTILNGILMEARFKSGFSPGKGLTSVLQCEEKNGKIYVDTPGLADEKQRKKAAKEIEKALKQDGDYRIFFVLTLESGRVRPQYKATMELVLQAAPEIGHNYGIIFNKISERALAKFVQTPSGTQPSQADILLTHLFSGDGLCVTNKLHYNLKDDDLEDAEDVVKALDRELIRFIEGLPAIRIRSSKVKEIKADQYEQMIEGLEKQMAKMQADNNLLMSELQSVRRAMSERGGFCFRGRRCFRRRRGPRHCPRFGWATGSCLWIGGASLVLTTSISSAMQAETRPSTIFAFARALARSCMSPASTSWSAHSAGLQAGKRPPIRMQKM